MVILHLATPGALAGNKELASAYGRGWQVEPVPDDGEEHPRGEPCPVCSKSWGRPKGKVPSLLADPYSWLRSSTASAAERLGWHSAGCRWDRGQRCSPLAPLHSPQAVDWAIPAAGTAGALAAALISARGLSDLA
jgi:hypothetical protein